MKLKSRIMHKGVRGHKLTEREQCVNVAISKTRYKVERTFGSIHRWFHGGIARYETSAKLRLLKTLRLTISKLCHSKSSTVGLSQRSRYVVLAKTHAQHIMEAIAYNLYRTPGIIAPNSLK